MLWPYVWVVGGGGKGQRGAKDRVSSSRARAGQRIIPRLVSLRTNYTDTQGGPAETCPLCSEWCLLMIRGWLHIYYPFSGFIEHFLLEITYACPLPSGGRKGQD